MNTANLQLQGLYALVAELLATLQAKGLLDGEETEAMLRRAGPAGPGEGLGRRRRGDSTTLRQAAPTRDVVT